MLVMGSGCHTAVWQFLGKPVQVGLVVFASVQIWLSQKVFHLPAYPLLHSQAPSGHHYFIHGSRDGKPFDCPGEPGPQLR